MAANPFDHTGTLDTTGYGLKSVTQSTVTGDVDQGNTSVDAVVAAFRDATLTSDAAARTLPSQRSFNRTF